MSGIAKLSNCKAILGVLAILFVLSGFFDCAMNLDTTSDNLITVGENTLTNSTIEHKYEGNTSNPALFFLTSLQSVQQDSTFKAKKISSTKKQDSLLKFKVESFIQLIKIRNLSQLFNRVFAVHVPAKTV